MLMKVQVEDYLFNIPSYALESGSPDLMSKIQSSFGATGKQIRPVVLDGVLRVDFKRLLRVLLPKSVFTRL